MSFESNLGTNRYVYRMTQTATYPPTSRAIPVASVVPSNAAEVGTISVAVEYSGWGYGGLRRTQGEFFEELAIAAQRLGGTHFHVQHSEGAAYITGLTVSVLRVPAEQPAAAAGQEQSLGTDADPPQSSPTATDSLTVEQLRAVVYREQESIQRCYEMAAHQTNQAPRLRVDVAVTIGPSGAVSAAVAQGQELGGILECVERSIREWRFPASSGTTRTSIPFIFRGREM